MAQQARPNEAGRPRRDGPSARGPRAVPSEVVLQVSTPRLGRLIASELMRTIVDELVREGIPRQVLDRPHERALRRQEEKRREHVRRDQHLDESEETELAKDDREGVHEDDFDVEDHENHRDQIEPNGESLRRFDFGTIPHSYVPTSRQRVASEAPAALTSQANLHEEHSENQEPQYW